MPRHIDIFRAGENPERLWVVADHSIPVAKALIDSLLGGPPVMHDPYLAPFVRACIVAGYEVRFPALPSIE